MKRSGTTRRRGGRLSVALLALALLAPALVGSTWPGAARAARDPIDSKELGELPTVGGPRPGPIGIDPVQFRKRGVNPIAIKIQKAEVDAQIEQQDIVNGVMQNPSGPYIVSWYRETGHLGEDDNIVMAGHLDYWDVGEAVFFKVWQLQKGDKIEVIGEDKVVYTYKVDWVKNYKIADLDAKGVQEIVGNTKTEKLTLITCGGPFDFQKGEYLERIVIRATRIA